MPEFVATIALDQLRPGKGKVVRIAGKDVALFNVDGVVRALDDACPHAGVSLGSSKLRGHIVTCRGHRFGYDVATGQCVSIAGLRAASYPVKILDGKILVSIDG
jgi:3-phenylpropionate/trans-cinnamate dioxygenase ferredoxin component